MTDVDHFLAAALALMSLGLLLKKGPSSNPAARRDFYVSASSSGLLLGGICLILWHFAGRELGRYGLVGWVGDPVLTAICAGLWLVLLAGWVLLVRRGMLVAWLRGIYSRYEHLMPVTRGELLGSWGTSLAAGAGEEIVYRGFLLWYAAELAGLHLAVVATSLLFGVAHDYQSWIGVLFATLAGLVLALICLASGSLILVMWIHATYNIASFTTGRLVLCQNR